MDAFGQDTLRRENGVIFLGLPLISPPNTLDGFGSADNGEFGDDYVYTYVEINDSYNGTNLENSTWMSYGDLLPEKFPDAIALGLGFFPDTFIWSFHTDTLFVLVKDAETTLTQDYTFFYDVFEGANPGPLDSLHIEELDGTLVEPSIIQIFPEITTSTEEVEWLDNLMVFPNPSDGPLNITFHSERLSDYNLIIHNTLGQRIHSERWEDIPSGTIRLQPKVDLGSGQYIIQINDGRNNISRTIIRY